MDDFGTGYSSLSYLRKFSFDKLKIDRSFVTDVVTSKENLAIVRAVVGLGKSFSATVAAEGVEDVKQYDCLKAQGCNQFQGYLFGRPVDPIVLNELLSRREKTPQIAVTG
ncbi:EAL domain-containing protein [Rhizobium wenxiniae]|uniref:EAL domain-containing protein n=1 Tax=Rhizobium wenxiniae TaxID=1737357 RepID=UPI003C27A6D9